MNQPTILLILALLLNLVRAFPLNDNEELVYSYKGRVLTGVAKEIQQLSGFGMKANLIVRPKGNGILMKLTDIEVGNINKQLNQDLVEEVKFNYAKPEGRLAEFTVHLEKPIHATLENGLVKSFEASAEDPYWSINIKKALLALFQIDMKGDSNNQHHPDYYRVKEDSINGKCETLYEITKIPSRKDPTKTVLQVSKQRFLKKCDDSPEQYFSNFWGWSCNSLKQEPKLPNPIKRSSAVTYVIDEDGYATHINGVNFIISKPFGNEGENPLSGVNQTLLLTEKRSTSNENMDIDGETITYNSLRYIFYGSTRDIEKDAMKGHHYNRLAAILIPEYFEKAHKIFEDILEESKFYEKPKTYNANKNFISLVRIFSAFSYDDFQKFFDQYISSIEDNKNRKTTKRQLLTDALPVVGTTPAALFIIHLAKSEDILEAEKQSMLLKLPFFVKEPTLKLVEEYRELAKTPLFLKKFKIITNMEESEEILSALGTLLYRGCKLSPPGAESSKHFISEDDCSKQLQSLIEDFHKATTVRGQIMYEKAIINTRLPKIKEFLLKVIEGGYSDIVRRLAIWGVVHSISENNDEIIRVLGKITRNLTEDYVTRTYAYEVLLFVSPDPGFMARTIYQMMRDPSKKLVSYMFSALQNYANSSCTCFQDYSKNVKFILQFLKPPQEEGIFFSGLKTLDFNNEKYQFGRLSQYLWIGNDRGFFPREMYTHQAITFSDTMLTVVEAGIVVSADLDLVTLIKESLIDIAEPPTDLSFDGVKLPFVTRESPFNIFDVYDKADVYVKIFHQFVRGYESVASTILSFHENPLDLKEGEEFLRRNLLFFGDFNHDIPNDFGFPLSFETKSLYSASISGISLFDTEKIKKDGIHLFFSNIHMNLIEGIAIEQSISVVTALGNAYGIGLNTDSTAKYALRGSIAPDFTGKSLTLKYKPSPEPYEIFHYKTQPFTFISNLVDLSPHPERSAIALIKYAEHPTTRTYNLGQNYFGVGLTATFKYDYYWNDFGSYRSFVKSFFKKQKTYDDYYYWIQRWYAGSRGLIDYAMMNPTFSPFEMSVEFMPSEDHPVEEFILKIKYEGSSSRPSEEEQNQGKVLDLDTFPDENTCDIKVSLTAVGKVERQWKAHCRMTTYWPSNTLRDCSIDFERSPLPGYDEKPFKFCLKQEMSYPKLLTLINNPVENFKVERKITLDNGENCGDGNEIQVKAILTKSDEQLQAFESPEVRQLFEKCKKSVITKQYNSKCWKEASDLFSLRKLSEDLDFKKTTPFMKNTMQRISSFIRHYLYDKMEIEQLNVANPENHIHIEANVSQKYPVVDITVNKPNENIYFKKLFIPAVIPRYQSFSINEDAMERFTYNLLHYRPYGSCIINNENIQTFDGVETNITWTDCYHVIARDCSHRSSLSVLAQRIQHPKFSKSIKIISRRGVIAEIKPDEEKEDALKLIPFEGTPVDLRYQSVKERKFNIRFYYYLDQYVVESKEISGFRIRFDGNEINVEISNLHRGNFCGLCGNFNLETKDEFEGPDRCIYDNPTSFSYSYAVPDDSCTIPEFHCPS